MAKQKSKKCVYKGIKFDSLVEKDWYIHLEEEQSKGNIFDLKAQVTFTIQDGFRLDSGEAVRSITYTADHMWTDKEGRVHCCDTKGSEFNIEEKFRIKFKMLKNMHKDYIYHIVIRYDGKWFDLEDKESKKQYKELKAIKKIEKEAKGKINKSKKRSVKCYA